MEYYKNRSAKILQQNYFGVTLTENWTTHPKYPNKYFISDFGRVASNGYGGYRIMKQEKLKKGYLRVKFYHKNKGKRFLVHLLVLEFFDRPRKNKLEEGNHLDFDKANNFLLNLKWATPKQNRDHAVKAGRFKLNKRGYKKSKVVSDKDVLEIRKLAGFIQQKVLAKKFNVCVSYICHIQKGIARTCVK